MLNRLRFHRATSVARLRRTITPASVGRAKSVATPRRMAIPLISPPAINSGENCADNLSHNRHYVKFKSAPMKSIGYAGKNRISHNV